MPEGISWEARKATAVKAATMAADRMVEENEMTPGSNVLARRRAAPVRHQSSQVRCDARGVDSRTSFAN
jgi:hypothetical protein